MGSAAFLRSTQSTQTAGGKPVRDSSSSRRICSGGLRPFNGREYEILAAALNPTRKRLPFALCGYCFMPDHIHVIISPEESTSISDVIKSFKLTTIELFRRSGDRDSHFWQSRFFDHALRTRKEYDEALSYVHMNREARRKRCRDAVYYTAHNFCIGQLSPLTRRLLAATIRRIRSLSLPAG
ncbi:MAG TPA: transposase [Bryobacterales bacterium]|nr:transposase [Bryobacterales bacterium]